MTDPAPPPGGVAGEAPVRRALVRHPSPLPQLRTVALGVSGMAAALGALSIVGLHGLPVEALTPVCLCIAGCVGGGAVKSSIEHVARAYSGREGDR